MNEGGFTRRWCAERVSRGTTDMSEINERQVGGEIPGWDARAPPSTAMGRGTAYLCV